MIITDISAPLNLGQPIREALLAQHKFLPPCTDKTVLRVFVIREPFDDMFLLVLDDGQTEELEDAETRQWLADRGASEDLINEGLTQAWNFKSALLHIKNPIRIRTEVRPETPRLNLL